MAYPKSYSEIAQVLTEEEGRVVTEEEVKSVVRKALEKLRRMAVRKPDCYAATTKDRQETS